MGDIKFDVREVAKYLHCSETSIRKLIKEQEIPHYRICTKILFDKNIIDKWLIDRHICKPN